MRQTRLECRCRWNHFDPLTNCCPFTIKSDPYDDWRNLFSTLKRMYTYRNASILFSNMQMLKCSVTSTIRYGLNCYSSIVHQCIGLSVFNLIVVGVKLSHGYHYVQADRSISDSVGNESYNIVCVQKNSLQVI